MSLAHAAAHASAVAAGARMENYGLWLRPAYFPRAGEDEHAAVAREVPALRGQAGLFDASPLGQIEVMGPDAAEFLQRVYANGVRNLKGGSCRSEEHTSELPSLMRISYAVLCLKKKN